MIPWAGAGNSEDKGGYFSYRQVGNRHGIREAEFGRQKVKMKSSR